MSRISKNELAFPGGQDLIQSLGGSQAAGIRQAQRAAATEAKSQPATPTLQTKNLFNPARYLDGLLKLSYNCKLQLQMPFCKSRNIALYGSKLTACRYASSPSPLLPWKSQEQWKRDHVRKCKCSPFNFTATIRHYERIPNKAGFSPA